MEQSRKSWDADMAVDLKLDTAQPLATIRRVLDDGVIVHQ